ACGVSLTNLDKVHLGFGNFWRTGQAEKGGSGTVYFDNIQVWPQRCIAAHASIADFTDDCIVDGYDLETMMEDWLMRDYNTLGYMGTLKGFPPGGDPNYDLAWVSGKIGTGALYFNLDDPDPNNPFDQGDDYVEIPPLNLNSNTVTFTVWAKRNGIQRDDGGLFFCSFRDDGDGVDATESGFVLGLGGDNWLNYNWNNEQGTYSWDPEPDFDLPDNQWAFCALTIAPDQARIFIKKDGEAMKYDTNIYTHVEQAFGIPSRIGDHKERRFAGVLDDFRIYNKTLSYAEVEWLAYQSAQGTNPTDANLYAHYEFEDGGGLTALDSAGDALNYWPVPSAANIAGDDIEPEYHRFVNLIDFAALADDWLVDMPWPRP
ncbi:MAG: LamG domain-containing protein, partial [Planctomycetota bacterium]